MALLLLLLLILTALGWRGHLALNFCVDFPYQVVDLQPIAFEKDCYSMYVCCVGILDPAVVLLVSVEEVILKTVPTKSKRKKEGTVDETVGRKWRNGR
jgi:hypothetical protein